MQRVWWQAGSIGVCLEGQRSSDLWWTTGFFLWVVSEVQGRYAECSAICLVHEEAGLGNPPEMFSINASKCLNTAIKSNVDYQKNELNKFIEKMRCLVDDQQKEVEQAVCCQGKYTFRSNYQFVEVNMVHNDAWGSIQTWQKYTIRL